MEQKIKVLIVDDHPLMRDALKRTFYGLEDIEISGEAGDGDEAVQKAHLYAPDVIIMDLGLPGKSGETAIAEIIKENPKARVLVFSGKNDQASVIRAIKAGAIGFIEKANPDVDIIKAVRETYQGMTTLKSEHLQALANQSQVVVQKNQMRDVLSEREQEIVDMIANGFDDQGIAGAMFLAESTVRSHINHIITKLKLTSRSELIRFVITGGLDLPVDKKAHKG